MYHKVHYALACGFGFGWISTWIQYTNLLATSAGPGKLESASCPSVDIIYLGAWQNLIFQLLNLNWSLISFQGWEQAQWWGPLAVVILHGLASYSVFHFKTRP